MSEWVPDERQREELGVEGRLPEAELRVRDGGGRCRTAPRKGDGQRVPGACSGGGCLRTRVGDWPRERASGREGLEDDARAHRAASQTRRGLAALAVGSGVGRPCLGCGEITWRPQRPQTNSCQAGEDSTAPQRQ